MSLSTAIASLTLPEAILLLAYDRHSGKLLMGSSSFLSIYGFVSINDSNVATLNRALLSAGILELILQNRVVSVQPQANINLLLYRLAPDFDPLPTLYTNDMWNLLIPHINADLFYPFRRLIRIAQTAYNFGDGFQVPDQTWHVAHELEARGIFDTKHEAFTPGKIPSFTEKFWLYRELESHILTTVFEQHKISTDLRTTFLLGLLYACELLPTVFGESHTLASARIRELCDFARQPETPIGNAYAYIRGEGSAS